VEPPEAAMFDPNSLDPILEEIITSWGIPGLAIGIVQGDEIVYSRGFGVQSLETQVPVTPESIFGVASVSKCFVATAVMRLAEQGKMDLAIEVLKLNLHAFPDHAGSRQFLTRLVEKDKERLANWILKNCSKQPSNRVSC